MMAPWVGTFAALFLGHLIGDFVLQNRWIVDNKTDWKVLLLHGVIHGAAAGLLLWTLDPVILGVILTTHMFIDWLKQSLGRGRWPMVSLTLDQALHLGVIIVLAVLFPSLAQGNLWADRVFGGHEQGFLAALIFFSGLIISVRVGSVAARLFLAQNQVVRRVQSDGIGARIGELERLLVYLLIFAGNITAIGFIVAAKTLLRFREVSTPGHRKQAEYVILGTLFSLAWAMTTALSTEFLINETLG